MTDAPIQIREAIAGDMPELLELWLGMMIEHARNDPRIRLTEGAGAAYRAYAGYHLTSSDSCVRVAESGGEIAGFCLLTISRNLPMFLPARYGYLSDLVVARACRRRGIGRALLREAGDWLRRRGVDSIQLQYYNFNEDGRAFWMSMGFTPYYTRMWLDLE